MPENRTVRYDAVSYSTVQILVPYHNKIFYWSTTVVTDFNTLQGIRTYLPGILFSVLVPYGAVHIIIISK